MKFKILLQPYAIVVLMSKKYNRVLLKLSGEQFAGSRGYGIDPNFIAKLAQEIREVVENTKVQIAIVIGGGNLVRGAEMAGHGIRRVTADQMGMLSGLMNAIALTDIFEANGVSTRCLSNLRAEQVAEPYVYRLANKHLESSRVIVIAGGLGRPYFTHDTAAVNLALELDCDVVLKATKVDGVYDKDPASNDDAVKLEEVTYQEALKNDDIRVMDKGAISMAMDNNMKLVVFDLLTKGNIERIVNGEDVGTKIES